MNDMLQVQLQPASKPLLKPCVRASDKISNMYFKDSFTTRSSLVSDPESSCAVVWRWVASMHAHAQSTITMILGKPFATTFHFCSIKWKFYPFIYFKHMRTSSFKKKIKGGLKIRLSTTTCCDTNSLDSFFFFFLRYFQLSEVVGMMNTFYWEFPLDCSHNQSTFKQECVPMCANGNTHINVHIG